MRRLRQSSSWAADSNHSMCCLPKSSPVQTTFSSDQLLVIVIEAFKNHVALVIIDVSLSFPVLVAVDETFSTTKKSHCGKISHRRTRTFKKKPKE